MSQSKHSPQARALAPVLQPLALAAALAVVGAPAWSLPEGAQLRFGQAQVQTTSPQRLDIRQDSARAGLDWTRFSIAAGEQVVISQPGRDAVLLNRVIGNDPSRLFGQLQSNGTVWLINPRGIVFGRDSQVDVGSLVASTLSIRGDDMAAGRLLLSRGPGEVGSIQADGRISAPDGSVVLVAPSLTQGGQIDARRIGLAAATEVQVDVEGDGLIFFNARNDGSLATRLSQLGTLRADGGTAELRAAGRAGFADTVLNLEGVVQARSIGRRDGRIVIDGGDSGLTRVAGTLDARGQAVGEQGGQVGVAGAAVSMQAGSLVDASGQAGGGHISLAAAVGVLNSNAPTESTGDLVLAGSVLALGQGESARGGQLQATGTRIGQFGGSLINVSGQGGGGRALLGGGWQGGGSLPHASLQLMAESAQVHADALAAGPGGQVVLWSDGLTRFDGTISARGGAAGGDGGQVETSGRQQLSVQTGRVDLSAATGATGQWLLDPLAIVVAAGGTAVYADVSTFAAATAAEPATIAPTALNGRAEVTLQASNSITVNSPIAMTVAAAPLTMQTQAGGTIAINSALSTTNGAISISSGSGGITSNGSGSINAGSGTIRLDGGSGNVTLGAGLTTTNATPLAINISNAANLQLNTVAAGAAGGITLNFSGTGNQVGGSITSGALTKAGNGVLTMSLVNGYQGGTTVTGGTLSISADNQLGAVPGSATPGNLTLAGGTLRVTETFDLNANRGVALQGTGTIEVADTKTLTLAAVVAGAATTDRLIKTGDGTLRLANPAPNTYAGGTTVTGGTLSISADNQLGAVPGSATPGNLTLAGGTLRVTETFDLDANRGVALQGTGTFQVADTKTLSVLGVVANGTDNNGTVVGSLVKGAPGAGRLTLSGNNSFTGTTTVDAGELRLLGGNAIADAAGQVTVNTGATLLVDAAETISGVAGAGTLTLNSPLTTGSSADSAFSGAIGGPGGLIKQGAGVFSLTNTAANSYAGGTTVTGGTLSISADNQLGAVPGSATPGNLTLAGGTLRVTETFDLNANRGVALQGTGTIEVADTKTLTLAAVVAGAATTDRLIKTGDGTLRLANPAPNTYAGGTTVTGGTLSISADNQLGAVPGSATPGNLTLAGGTLRVTETFDLDANRGVALQGTGTFQVADTKTLSVLGVVANGTDNNGTVVGSLVKGAPGAGRLTLSGNNSFTGTTTVDAGELRLLGGNAIADAAGQVTVNTGATLLVDAAETISGVAGAGTLTLNSPLTTGSSADSAFSGAIGGPGGLIKQGAGVFSLTNTAANSYAGGTTVTGGTLSISADNQLGAVPGSATPGNLTLAGGTLRVTETFDLNANRGVALQGTGTIEVADTKTLTLAAVVAGAATTDRLIKTGDGTLRLANPAPNTYAGGTTVTGGTLSISADNQLGAVPGSATPGNLTLAGGTLRVTETFDLDANRGVALQGTGTFQVADTKTLSVLGVVANGTDNNGTVVGSLVKGAPGAGRLTLSGNNSFTGTTTVDAGELRLLGGNAIADAAGQVTVNTGATLLVDAAETISGVAGAGTLTLNSPLTTGSSADSAFSGAIGGPGGLIKQGAGVFSLTNTAANSYAGGTTVTGGTLSISADNQLGAVPGSATPGNLTLAGGTLRVTETFDLNANRGVALQGTGTIEVADTKTLTLAAVVAGAATTDRLIKTGAGTLTFNNANTYTGDTNVQAGVLQLNNAQALGSSALVLDNVAGATVQLLGNSSVKSLAGGGTTGGNVDLGSFVLSVVGDGTATNYTGVISGTGGVSKSGDGSLTLRGANTYSGTTTVSNGTLALGTAGERLANSSRLVVTGGTFDLGTFTETVAGVQQTGGVIRNGTLVSTTNFDMQAGAASALLAGNVGLDKTTAGTQVLSGANTYTGDTRVQAGVLQLNNAQALGSSALVLDNVAGAAVQLLGNSGVKSLAGGGTTGGNVDLGSFVLSVVGNGTATDYTGVISGTGGVSKSGDGSLTLRGANTYSGMTTVSNGTLALGTAGERLDNTSRVVVAGGTFDLGTFTETVAGVQQTGGVIRNGTLASTSNFDMQAGAASAVLAGNVGLDKTTAGTLILSGANTYTGATTVRDGKLSIGTDNNLGAAPGTATPAHLTLAGGTLLVTADMPLAPNRGVALQGTGTIEVAATRTLLVSGIVADGSAPGGLNKTGAGTLTFNNANTYTGDTNVQAGVLQLNNAQALGSSALVLDNVAGATVQLLGNSSVKSLAGGGTTGGNVDLGSFVLSVVGDGTATSYAGVISGTGGVSKSGTGTLTFSGANTYTGDTRVLAGVLQLNNAQALGSSALVLDNAAGATVRLLGNSGVKSLAGGGATGGNLDLGSFDLSVLGDGTATSYAGVISGTGGVSKSGTGTLTFSGANTYTGDTNVQAGVLQLNNAQALGSSALVLDNAAGATVRLLGNSSVKSLAGGGATGGNLALGSFDLSVLGDGTATDYAGVISGTGGLNKTGTGTLTLHGANTYTGTTTVSDGTLALGTAGERLANNSRVVVAGGTFDLGTFTETVAGVQQTGGVIRNGTLVSTSNFDMQAGAASAVLAGHVGLNKTTAGTLVLSGANTYTGTTTVSNGTLALGTAGERLANSSRLVVTGGTFDLGTFTETLAGVQQTGGVIRNGTLVSTTNFDMQAGAASAVLAGNVGLNKTTAGTQVLSGANTYTGDTRVQAGVLQLNNVQALGSSALVLDNVAGATVQLLGNSGVKSLAGGGATGGNLDLGSFDLSVDGDGTATSFAGLISGAGGVTKAGNGSLTLRGANTYSGTTTVSNGTLALGTANERLANSSRVVVTGGTFDLGTFTETVAGVQQTGGVIRNGTLVSTSNFDMQAGAASAVLAGNVGLDKTTPGTLVLSGANAYTGDTNVQAGVLQLNNAQALGSSALVLDDVAGAAVQLLGNSGVKSLAGGGTSGGNVDLGSFVLSVVGDGTATSHAGVISGTGGVTKSGTGALTLHGANTYTGSTTVSNGTLALGTAGARLADTSRLVVAGGTFDLGGFTETVAGVQQTGGVIRNGTLVSTSNFDMQAGQASAVLAGAVGLVKTTAGVMTLSGANTYSGDTRVQAGKLQLNNAQALGSSALVLDNVAGATVQLLGDSGVKSLAGGGATGGNLDLGSFVLSVDGDGTATSYAGVISGAGGVTKAGNGSLTLHGANTYSGTTTVSNGTLALGTANERLANSSRVVVMGGTFDLGGFTETVAGVQQTAGVIRNGTLASSSNFDMQAGAASAVLAGNVGLDKTTTGTLVLGGASTYTGTTTVHDGTLALGNANERLASSSRLVVAGGTFDLGGFTETVAGVQQTGGVIRNGSLASTSNFDMRAGEVSAALAGSVGLDKTTGATLSLSGANTYSGTTTVRDGTLALANANERLANSSRLVVVGGTLDLGGFTETVAGVQLTGGVISHGTLASTSNFDMQAGAASAVLAGNVGLDKTTAGTLVLSGANTYTGTTTVRDGTLALGTAGERLADSSRLVVAGGTFDLGGFTETVAGVEQTGGVIRNGTLVSTSNFDMRAGEAGAVLAGAVGLDKTTAGTFILSNHNSYTGQTTVAAGTLQLAGTQVLWADGMASVAAGATLRLDGAQTLARLDLAGTLTGTGPLDTLDFRSFGGFIDLPLVAALLQVSGETQLNTDATVNTVQVLAGGRLAMGVDGHLLDTASLAVDAGGTLHLQGAQSVGTLTLAGTLDGTGVLTASTYALQGGQALTALGTGMLTSSGNSLLNAPAPVASVVVQDGVFTSGANASLTALPAVTVASGTRWALQSAQRIGSLAGAGQVDLAAHALRTGAGGDSLFGGVISGQGSLIKQGGGQFTLAGANTFSGDTVVEAGTLALSGANRLADASQVQVAAGATLALDATDTVAALQLAGTLAGSGQLTAARYLLQSGRTEAGLGAGALQSSGDSTVAGVAAVNSIDIADGRLTLAATAQLTGAPATRVAGGSNLALLTDTTLGSLTGTGDLNLGTFTLRTGAGGDSRFDGVISGDGTLEKLGATRFTMGGSQQYTGGTTVLAGRLALDGADRLADAGTVTVASGAVLALAGNDRVASLQLQGTLAGSGTLSAATYALDGGHVQTDLGDGLLTSRGSSTVAGRVAAQAIDVLNGRLTLTGADQLADTATVTVAAGTSLTLNAAERIGNLQLAGTLDGTGTLSASRTTLQDGQVQANLGSGTLESRGDSRLIGHVAVDNLAVLDGRLTLGSAGRLTAAPATEVAANTRLVLGGDETLGQLTGAGDVAIGAFTLNTGAGGSSTFAGVIDGDGGLVKLGANTTFSLTGTNLYRGRTWVAEGTLALGDGGRSGTIDASRDILVDGTLLFNRADAVLLDKSVDGSGGITQAGSGTLSLSGSNKTYRGPTEVRSGILASVGDEALSDNSAVQVNAGTQLQLGGAETIAALQAAGTVSLGSRLTASGALVFNGPAVVQGGGPLLLQAASIDAMHAGNSWGSRLSLDVSGNVRLSSGEAAGGGLQPLTLGDVQIGTTSTASAGRIEAASILLDGTTRLRGGTLALDLQGNAALVEPTDDVRGRKTPVDIQIAFTDDLLRQTPATPTRALALEIDAGAQLDVTSAKGSVALLNPDNRIDGGLSVVLGTVNKAWNPGVSTPGTTSDEYSLQQRARITGSTLRFGGAGIQADVVRLEADSLATDDQAVIVARLPYDNQAGTAASMPGLTLVLRDPGAFADSGGATTTTFGSGLAALRVNVGSISFGNRTDLLINGGYVSLQPTTREGGMGRTAVFLVGPETASGYSFFYDGARRQGTVPVFYNGESAVPPQVSGSISATLAVSEGARKERFDEAVRTENVALRLRGGVIAEVGPGLPATVNTVPMNGLRPPACKPEPGTLACAP